MGGANQRIVLTGGGRRGARSQGPNIPPEIQRFWGDSNNTSFTVSPTKLFVTIFRTQFVDNLPMSDFFAAAEKALKPHGVELDVLPADKNPFVIDYNGGPINTELDVSSLRQSASRKFSDNGNPPRLPIIFCKFQKAFESEAAGVTFVNSGNPPDGTTTLADGSTWLPFCCVDGAPGTAFVSTMVHEMGHAALIPHDIANGAFHSPDPDNVMNLHKADEKANPRFKLHAVQVRALAASYFARPRTALPYPARFLAFLAPPTQP